MIVCPQCQFENSDANKFCQQCGTSLTQIACPECSTLVSFEALQCQVCGTPTATIWWAIITRKDALTVAGGFEQDGLKQDDLKQDGLEQPREAPVSEGEGSVSLSPIAPETDLQYLDVQHRYLLLDPLALRATTSEIQTQVLDRQPFAVSPLEPLVNPANSPVTPGQDADSNETIPLGSVKATVEAVGDSPPLQAVVAPTIAQAYLALQAKFPHTVPLVHDAWQQDGQGVLLLEDRSTLPRLIDLWSDDQILPLQLLYWMNELADLWLAFEPWQCCESLLVPDNLRVDEDQVLCLQRLYSESGSRPYSLQTLGEMWQALFEQSQRTQFASLALLISDLQSGKISTIADLRSQIQATAHELQDPSTVIPMTSESSSLESTNLPAGASPEVEASLPVAVSPTQTTLSPADIRISTAPTQLEEPLLEPKTGEITEAEVDSDDMPTVVLPMQLVSLDDSGRTDIGRQRDHNEDYFGIETRTNKLESPTGRSVRARGLYILCDGMGGHAGGEVASALAVDTLRRYFQTQWPDALPSDRGRADANQKLPSADQIREAVQAANRAIYDVNQQNSRSGSGRMGTTLVMMLVHNTEAAIVHVGDSRLYRLTRKRGLEQLTVDHEVGQREIQRGIDPAIAYARPDAYQLTQALGPRDENFVSPDVQFFEINEDMLLLLCSDGLTDNDLLETHWRTHVEPLLSSQANLDQGLVQLIELANQYNGHDNITAIAIRAKVRPNLEQLR